jgi:hypothetical protein
MMKKRNKQKRERKQDNGSIFVVPTLMQTLYTHTHTRQQQQQQARALMVIIGHDANKTQQHPARDATLIRQGHRDDRDLFGEGCAQARDT